MRHCVACKNQNLAHRTEYTITRSTRSNAVRTTTREGGHAPPSAPAPQGQCGEIMTETRQARAASAQECRHRIPCLIQDISMRHRDLDMDIVQRGAQECLHRIPDLIHKISMRYRDLDMDIVQRCAPEKCAGVPAQNPRSNSRYFNETS